MEPIIDEHTLALAKKVSDKIANDFAAGHYKTAPQSKHPAESDLWIDEELDALLASGDPEALRESITLTKPTGDSPIKPTTSHFPAVESKMFSSSAEALCALTALMATLRKSGDYQSIRDEYCRLSIEINSFCLLAPAGRPPVNTGKKWGNNVFKEIHRDQLVIDCHWLHATKQRVNINAKDIEFAALFDHSADFPFELAWEFATKEWKATHRVVTMLRLTPFQQYQLLKLHDANVRSVIDFLEKPRRESSGAKPAPIDCFEQQLNAWCERDPRVAPYRAGYLAVWKSRQFLGSAASVSQIGKLAAYMLGESPKDDKTIRSREEKIGRHILS